MDNGAGDVDDLSHLVDFCQTGVRGIGRVGTGFWASAAVGTGCCTAATHPLYYQPATPTQHQRQKYTSDLRHYHWATMSPLFCKVCVKHFPDPSGFSFCQFVCCLRSTSTPPVAVECRPWQSAAAPSPLPCHHPTHILASKTKPTTLCPVSLWLANYICSSKESHHP